MINSMSSGNGCDLEQDFNLHRRKNICYVSIGGGSSKSKTKSKQQSGVAEWGRDQATEQLFEFINNNIWPAIQEFSKSTPRVDVDPNTGLTRQQSALAGSMVQTGIQNQFNKMSASNALKGQLSHKNTSALIGSSTEKAVNAAMPQFADMAQKNMMFNTTADQNTKGQSFNFMQALAGILGSMTQGSEGQTSGGSSAWNFDAAFKQPGP